MQRTIHRSNAWPAIIRPNSTSDRSGELPLPDGRRRRSRLRSWLAGGVHVLKILIIYLHFINKNNWGTNGNAPFKGIPLEKCRLRLAGPAQRHVGANQRARDRHAPCDLGHGIAGTEPARLEDLVLLHADLAGHIVGRRRSSANSGRARTGCRSSAGCQPSGRLPRRPRGARSARCSRPARRSRPARYRSPRCARHAAPAGCGRHGAPAPSWPARCADRRHDHRPGSAGRTRPPRARPACRRRRTVRARPLGDLIGATGLGHAVIVQHAEQAAQLAERVALRRFDIGLHVGAARAGIQPYGCSACGGRPDPRTPARRAIAGLFHDQQFITAKNEVHSRPLYGVADAGILFTASRLRCQSHACARRTVRQNRKRTRCRRALRTMCWIHARARAATPRNNP